LPMTKPLVASDAIAVCLHKTNRRRALHATPYTVSACSLDVHVAAHSTISFRLTQKCHMQWLSQPGKLMREQLAHVHGPTANLVESFSRAGRSNLPDRVASGYLATDDKQKKRRSENQIAQFLHVLSRFG